MINPLNANDIKKPPGSGGFLYVNPQIRLLVQLPLKYQLLEHQSLEDQPL